MGKLTTGETVNIKCQNRGTNVNGSTLWDFVQYKVTGVTGAIKRGWVSDYYVKTGTSGPLADVQQGSCPAPVTRFLPGGRLSSGQTISAPLGYSLRMQSDGNLVLHSGSTPVWATGTHGNAGAYMRMQTDGNLVVYTAGGRALWASRTNGNPGSYLDIQADGNVVVYSSSGRALWARR